MKYLLNLGVVFSVKDTTGDLVGRLLYVKSKNGNQLTILTSDGKELQTTVSTLNIDLNSIRVYNAKIDPNLFKEKN